MDASVLIPTHGRPDIIRTCLDHLTRQTAQASFEVLVGVDGGEQSPRALALPDGLRGEVIDYPKLGPIAVRRRLLERASGNLIVSLNDDSLAAPDLVARHLAMHEPSEPRFVAGAAPWVPVTDRDLFDEMVERTDLVFFRPRAPGATEPYPIGYRDCYGLNMSFPRRLALDLGGFHDLRNTYGYEDPEIAFRLERAGCELWHDPNAIVHHQHRYRPESVMKREYLLGRTAFAYASASPGFARDLFGRDILAQDELDFSRETLHRERRDAARIERSFIKLATLPSDAASDEVLQILAEHWVLLKRLLWRWGLVDAADQKEPGWCLLGSSTC